MDVEKNNIAEFFTSLNNGTFHSPCSPAQAPLTSEEAPFPQNASVSSDRSQNSANQCSEDQHVSTDPVVQTSSPPPPPAQAFPNRGRRNRQNRTKRQVIMDDYYKIVAFLTGNASNEVKREAGHKNWKRKFAMIRVRLYFVRYLTPAG